MKKLLIILVLFSCAEDEPMKEEHLGSCIYQRNVSTNGQNVGLNPYTFLRCDPDPNFRTDNPQKYYVEQCICND